MWSAKPNILCGYVTLSEKIYPRNTQRSKQPINFVSFAFRSNNPLDNAKDLAKLAKTGVQSLMITCSIVHKASFNPNQKQRDQTLKTKLLLNQLAILATKKQITPECILLNVNGLLQIADVDVYSADCFLE